MVVGRVALKIGMLVFSFLNRNAVIFKIGLMIVISKSRKVDNSSKGL